MNKYTPKPWLAEETKLQLLGSNGADWVATFHPGGRLTKAVREESLANLRLAEAAPDLLAMLEDFVNFVAPGDDATLGAMLTDARAIIAKARSES